MSVKKGDKVKVDYTGSFDDGIVFDSSSHGDHSHPLEFSVGEGQVVKGFDDAILGMEVNEEKVIKIPPTEAYGERNDQLLMKAPSSKLPAGAKEGMGLMLMTPEGQQMPATIIKISGEEVTLDLNHPLAGKVLNFKLKLISIN